MLRYRLRFRFPHFDPLVTPDTTGIPSFARSFLAHRQHVNTMAALPRETHDEFRERFVLRPYELALGAIGFRVELTPGRMVFAYR